MFLSLCAVMTEQATARSLTLESDTDVATAGYFQLRWSAGSEMELQESRTPDFASARAVYSGFDAGRVISGKPDGDWYYRAVLPSNGAFSNTVKVTVHHHPMKLAIGYFAVGLSVFLATLALIVNGGKGEHRRSGSRTGTRSGSGL